MSTASLLPIASRTRRWRFILRRPAAWLLARIRDPETGLWLVITFALLHALIWTQTLVKLKAAQDVHMDVAEAFAWGQKFQWGYGKHPPLSGWIAGLWFRFFPVADWATYLLAMTVLGVGLVLCYLIALRVGDRRPRLFGGVPGGALSDLQFQGFQIQRRPAAARHPAAPGPGLSRRLQEAHLVVGRLSRYCRRS